MSPIIDIEKSKRKEKIYIQNARMFICIMIISLFATLSSFGIFVYLLITNNRLYHIPLIVTFLAGSETSILGFLAYYYRKNQLQGIVGNSSAHSLG
jgi:hypothetical protein